MSSPDEQGFSLVIDNNPYLAEGSGAVDAVITIATEKEPAATPGMTLRLWVPAGARVVLTQVQPGVDDLTDRGTEAGSQLTDYPLGAWGTAERAYHLHVEVQPAAVGREKLAARVSLIAGGAVVGEANVRAIWTDDAALSARRNRLVAHYVRQEELAKAIRDGLNARERGDVATATAKLKRALEIAEESGDENTAGLLSRVVDFDRNSGTARLRREVGAADRVALDDRSSRTLRVRKDS